LTYNEALAFCKNRCHCIVFLLGISTTMIKCFT
jgi:hypothetical protein